MATYSPSATEIERAWYVIDASEAILGRLATRVASVLRGKHKPTFAPHLDGGDFVIVINAAEVTIGGAKADQKLYHSHSGFPGGIKSVPFLRLMERSPEQVVEKAVLGMLPKSRLGRAMGKKLKVYAGAEHPHAAQQPLPFPTHV
jgi:large subunit ribosomal protein L13